MPIMAVLGSVEALAERLDCGAVLPSKAALRFSIVIAAKGVKLALTGHCHVILNIPRRSTDNFRPTKNTIGL